MNPDTRTTSSTPPGPPPVRNLELKAALLLLSMVLLLVASALYVMYARGLFESTQPLVLIAEDSEGVTVGTPVTFAGFAIGRVERIELSDQGKVRFLVQVPTDDARWLRTSSIFTMERSLVGGVKLRAFSGVLEDPPLEPGAERVLLSGDATAELPQVLSTARQLLENLNAMVMPEAPLARSLANVETLTTTLQGPQGAMALLFGNSADAGKVSTALDRTNALLQRADQLTARLDRLVANADRQVFGQPEATNAGPSSANEAAGAGLLSDVKGTVAQLNGLLAEARGRLQQVEAVLVEAQGIASNTREATTDLGALRAEVESSLRQIESLVNDINRRWPFARETEIRLP